MMQRLLILVVLVTLWSSAADAQQLSLKQHLQQTANEHNLSLVYSSSIIPDTTLRLYFPKNFDVGLRLERLTKPFGLRYSILSQQLIISRRPPPPPTINGYVEDRATGERLPGATVVSLCTGRGAVTNGYGYFSIAGICRTDTLAVQYLGYPIMRRPFNGNEKTVILQLTDYYQLNAVEITAALAETDVIPVSERPVTPQILSPIVYARGEPDLNAWLMQRTGVSAQPGGFNGYSIRGANPQHNLIILDDATLYLPSHLNGYKSAVPGNALRSFTLYKNGGEARYGDRVGGVLDLRVKEGNRERAQSSATVSLEDAQFTTEGPFGKASYFLSARRGLTDLWLNTFRPVIEGQDDTSPKIDAGYFDVLGKVNYSISDRHRIYFSMFTGQDYYEDENEYVRQTNDDINTSAKEAGRRWNNTVGSFRYAASIGSSWFLNSTFTASQFGYQATDYDLKTVLNTISENKSYSFAQSLYRSTIVDIGFRQDVEYAWRPGIRLEFGIDVKNHNFRARAAKNFKVRLDSLTSNELSANDLENLDLPLLVTSDIGTYTSVHYTPNEHTRIDIGLRVAGQFDNEFNYLAVLPRVRAERQVRDNIRLHLAGGLTRQFVHALSSVNPGLPRDLWVPSVGSLKPQRGAYLNGGLSVVAGKDRAFAVSTYVQRFKNLARFSPEGVGDKFLDWAEALQFGRGLSYGIETEGRFSWRRTQWEVGYTWSRSNRNYDRTFIDEATEERGELDRRHQVSIQSVYTLTDVWSGGLTFTYGSGAPTRIPRRNIADLGGESNSPLTNSNSFEGDQIELDPVHQLSLGVNRTVHYERGKASLNMGVQNAYFRKNPLFYNLRRRSTGVEGQIDYEDTLVFMLPVLPFVRFERTF